MMQATTTLTAIRTLDKRILLTGLLLTLLAVGFWSGSRYPDLNRKAAVGSDMGVRGLSFDVLVQGTATDAWWRQIGAATINWIETNKRGMTFGLLMAAAMLTMLSLIARRSVTHPIGNSLIGVLIGAPMGLCVNCSTPVATAMYRGGTRLETSLAMLVSSPTMNAIVLTMLLALFPWHIWLTQIVMTSAFVILGIPLICRLFFRREAQAAVGTVGPGPGAAAATSPVLEALKGAAPASPAGWPSSAVWTMRTFAKQLWWLVWTAVPLMLLAGLLGSIVITFAPWDVLERFATADSRLQIVVTMAVFAVIGTFLPVPMAFDVIVCAILFERGLPAHYTMVLLFTLGTFSVYPFLMLRKAASLRVALVLYAAIAALGVGSGVIAHFLEEFHIARQEKMVAGILLNEPPAPWPALPQPAPALDEKRLAAALPPPLEPALVYTADGIRVDRLAFRPAAAGASGSPFSRHDGHVFGIDVPTFFSPRKLLLRTPETNRPIASGDVHGDGWPDLLIGADHDIGGLVLFANAAGKGFVRQRVDLGALNTAMVQTAALVDLDGDSWLDIFFTTFDQGNFAVRNRGGRFTGGDVVRVSQDRGTLAQAVAFGDLNRDGRLDLVVGNWSMSHKVAQGTPVAAANRILMSEGDLKYSAAGIEGPPGYTLSTLLTDFNDDGVLDFISGNDFQPDSFYIGDGNGGFRRLLRADRIIPATGRNTMSVVSADLDNDLQQELFIAQIAIGTNRKAMLDRRMSPQAAVADVERAADRERLQAAVQWWPIVERMRSEDLAAVGRIEDPWLRQQFACYGVSLLALRRVSRDWALMLPDHCGASEFIQRAFSTRHVPSRDDLARGIPMSTNRSHNTLLQRDAQGMFVERETQWNALITDWTWNARFADTDNDGWQDLYTANGWLRQDAWESNVYLRNVNGETFRNDTKSAGLVDHLPTSAFTYVDLNLDGDLDIVSVPVLGPVRVFVNNSRGARAVQIELRDQAGNSRGIGSRIVIHYGKNGELHQMREIQAGGGFVSYDETVAHFGLGAHDAISRVEVRWSTGETTTIDRRLDAGYRYIIRRQAGR